MSKILTRENKKWPPAQFVFVWIFSSIEWARSLRYTIESLRMSIREEKKIQPIVHVEVVDCTAELGYSHNVFVTPDPKFP